MSFKTKALGLLAGSALMLSVAGGATADDATGTASVTFRSPRDAARGNHKVDARGSAGSRASATFKIT